MKCVTIACHAVIIVCILQVKRIMNNVYYMLRNEFEANDTYTGSDIMKVVLKTIKVRTNSLRSHIVFTTTKNKPRRIVYTNPESCYDQSALDLCTSASVCKCFQTLSLSVNLVRKMCVSLN